MRNTIPNNTNKNKITNNIKNTAPKMIRHINNFKGLILTVIIS